MPLFLPTHSLRRFYSSSLASEKGHTHQLCKNGQDNTLMGFSLPQPGQTSVINPNILSYWTKTGHPSGWHSECHSGHRYLSGITQKVIPACSPAHHVLCLSNLPGPGIMPYAWLLTFPLPWCHLSSQCSNSACTIRCLAVLALMTFV